MIDLKFQFFYVTLKKIHSFEEYNEAPANTVLQTILIKHRESTRTLDGKESAGSELKIKYIT